VIFKKLAPFQNYTASNAIEVEHLGEIWHFFDHVKFREAKKRFDSSFPRAFWLSSAAVLHRQGCV